MWTLGAAPAEEERDPCDEMVTLLDEQIGNLEACTSVRVVWDGHCGLVQLCDEDLLSSAEQPDPAPAEAAQPAAPAGQAPAPNLEATQQPAAPPAAAATGTTGTRSSSAGQTAREVAGQSAEQLVRRAEELLQRGEAAQAAPLLRAALQRCPLGSAALAGWAIDLTLSAERQAAEAGASGAAAAGPGEGVSGMAPTRVPLEVQRELRFARDSLSRGEARRALQHLRYAASVCPVACSRERRRIQLYTAFVEAKRHL